MVEVNERLYLGSEDDAGEVVYGKKLQTISHILSIVRDSPSWILGDPDESRKEEHTTLKQNGASGAAIEESEIPKREFTTLHIKAIDSPKTDLLSHFEKCCNFIQSGLDGGGSVMVHCVYGISRSATLVLAYLMKKEGRRFEVILQNVQRRKPDVRPNEGFVKQLKLWGEMRCRLDLNYKPYKMYRLIVHSASFTQNNAEEVEMETERLALGLDPGSQEIESQGYYRCRKCRRLLFTDDSVMQHDLGEGFLPFYSHLNREETLNVRPTSETSCSSYFIEPVEWMDQLVSSGEVSGKVQCPKCSCKLGSYSWCGQQCSCGHWVTPSFQVHKNRVDEIRSLVKRKGASSES